MGLHERRNLKPFPEDLLRPPLLKVEPPKPPENPEPPELPASFLGRRSSFFKNLEAALSLLQDKACCESPQLAKHQHPKTSQGTSPHGYTASQRSIMCIPFCHGQAASESKRKVNTTLPEHCTSRTTTASVAATTLARAAGPALLTGAPGLSAGCRGPTQAPDGMASCLP